jgi:predicted alpha/beta hydrolase family esterase
VLNNNIGKQQVLIIGGGTSFETYNDYLSNLKNRELTLDSLRPSGDWKDILPKKLGVKYDVFVPKMPNKANAVYNEWNIWFERIIQLLDNNLILIGHSLGGIYLAKYLSENKITRKVKATFLVAAPFKSDYFRESLASFTLKNPLSNLAKQGGIIYIIHSKDDPVVPFEQSIKYEEALPQANKLVFNNKGHFNQETFPEIVKLIKTL